MSFKKTPFTIQDKNTEDLDIGKDYPTIADLIKEQEVSNYKLNPVHQRRDLDSLGWFKPKNLVIILKIEIFII